MLLIDIKLTIISSTSLYNFLEMARELHDIILQLMPVCVPASIIIQPIKDSHK